MATQQQEQRTLVNRKGRTVVTNRSDGEAFAELERRVDEGSVGEFARDLVSKGRRYGLSEEQYWWVHKLLVPPTELDCSEVATRMRNARRNGVGIKALRLTVSSDEGNVVQLSMAGSRSKYCGDIWVTDGGVYPDNTLYGRIDAVSGMFLGSDVPDDVTKVLEDIQDNPEDYMPW